MLSTTNLRGLLPAGVVVSHLLIAGCLRNAQAPLLGHQTRKSYHHHPRFPLSASHQDLEEEIDRREHGWYHLVQRLDWHSRNPSDNPLAHWNLWEPRAPS